MNTVKYFYRYLFTAFILLLTSQFSVFANGEEHGTSKYDPVTTVMNHISDANEIHFFQNVSLPLPCILYAPDEGFSFFLSSKFHHGHKAFNGYVLNHGRVNRITDTSFPKEEVDIGHIEHKEVTDSEGKNHEVFYFEHNDKEYEIVPPSTVDGGIFGGGITSFYDFSITKNVATLFLAAFLLIWIFLSVAKKYKRREGKAPSGFQNFIEIFFVFIKEEVTEPLIGKNYEKYQPFVMTLFFFILILNLLGLVPPLGANVTGNIAVTATLAILTFIITNINGNKNYWQHVFWMPGIAPLVKIILTPVELLGLFIKPFSLAIRLLANMAAGHITILSLVGLIFIFGHSGESLMGASGGSVISVILVAFINLIELLVAFIQAFVFAMLSASYIGAAIEEHH